ncbi:MAG: PH-like domain-containing protein [Gulosibacter sp.]|uniref:PH-like domain-containing protein n=1 Tax=Gulosibacter sp. TaxID=2817531 RepID=UPI003F90DF77
MGWLITLSILAIIAIIIGGMWLGWRRRRKGQADLSPAPELPQDLGEPNFAVDDAHYVATSVTGNALNRIAVRPLAYRGRAVVEVHPSGIAIGIQSERPFFIPREQMTLVARTQATIDRAVEPDGLIAIQWNIDPTHSVETFIRIVNPKQRAELLEAAINITPNEHATREEHK